MNELRLGVDVGGTFTDFVLFRGDREVLLHKRLSTPTDPSIGVIEGLREMAQRYGFRPSELRRIVHGTTVVANALIERRGDPTALITTEGFGDVLEIGREVRYDIYDLSIQNPEPLVPRYRRHEIEERVLADGTVRTSATAGHVDAVLEKLDEAEVRSVAVCLVNAHANDSNERDIAARILAARPDLHLTLSSSIAPEIREYERMSTTVANAYVHPLVDRYLARLTDELAELGFGGTLFIMLSHGGVAAADFVRARPIQLVESGPAAGVEATVYLGRRIQRPDLIAFDMGGTTAKACVIDKGEATYATETEVARMHRFKRGSGMPLKVPSVDMIEIGAGGGSIAHLDHIGLLKVGPMSAGAEPGPAAYGLGGCRPTVTDANLVLGYLNPDNFLGGRMRLDVGAAERAIEENIAKPLAVDKVEAAAGIVGLANENMATATRLYLAERGKDPQGYALVAFGGAGPVHAYRVARTLRIAEVIYPTSAGALSALGFLVAPAAIHFVRSYVSRLDRLDWDRLTGLYLEMREEALAMLANTGVAAKEISYKLLADMRYVGQGHELEVEIDDEQLAVHDNDALAARFEAAYRDLFGMTLEGLPIEALNWRLAAKGPSGEAPSDTAAEHPSRKATSAKVGERDIFLPDEKTFRGVSVLDRYRLTAGTRFEGPAIIEEHESTVVIDGTARIEVDALKNLRVHLAGD